MNYLMFVIGSTLPMAFLVFVGSYFGIWKRRERKIPYYEAVILFIVLWVVAAVLTLLTSSVFSGYEEAAKNQANLWGPLLIGIFVGRRIVDWRTKVNGYAAARKSYEKN